jgi:hypothetical protein
MNLLAEALAARAGSVDLEVVDEGDVVDGAACPSPRWDSFLVSSLSLQMAAARPRANRSGDVPRADCPQAGGSSDRAGVPWSSTR